MIIVKIKNDSCQTFPTLYNVGTHYGINKIIFMLTYTTSTTKTTLPARFFSERGDTSKETDWI